MSHTLRPQATCIRKALCSSKRSISCTPSRRLPEIEAREEEQQQPNEEDLPLSACSTSPPTFLSTRPEIDAYLRAQNDAYLLKLQKNLEALSRTAESINTLLPTFARRAAHIRPPSSSSSTQNIPPYTALPYRKSAEVLPPITQSLLAQLHRVQQNILDLQAEPYRADITPSEREKLEKKVGKWTREERERELRNVELQKYGMEARFLRGVEGLERGVGEMIARREERERERGRKEGGAKGKGEGDVGFVDRSGFVCGIDARGGPVSYRPFGGDRTTATAAAATAGMDNSATEGWGSSATKIEERGKVSRTANPFEKTTAPSPSVSSSTKNDLEALRRRLKSDSPSPAEMETHAPNASPKVDAETAKAAEESQAEQKAEPKIRSLAELQRRMNALQGEKK